jgi:membrane-associated phospholipid phosphatase
MARLDAGQHALARPRHVLRVHGQPGHPYLLHGLLAYPVLVRLYKPGPSVREPPVTQCLKPSATSDMCSTVFMLAAGIYWSGFLKDMLCLPRPLSPPLARISMSGSAALEYGFPSSHSTNAVSVTFYAIYMLRQTDEYSPAVNLSLQALFYLYAVSIILGRLYCGMHGFLDVLVGSILGALITVFQLTFSDWIDSML